MVHPQHFERELLAWIIGGEDPDHVGAVDRLASVDGQNDVSILQAECPVGRRAHHQYTGVSSTK